MINYVWFAMICSGIIVAASQGRIEAVTKAAMEGADTAVKISLNLIAIITFWLGVMKLAEKAGIVRFLARLVQPITSYLYPSIPKDHPAMGAIVMNLSANILGLGNAATPMGLVAMKEMQKLNRGDKETATEAMCTFLAMNTSCITIVPTTIIGIRLIYGSNDPTAIVGTTIFATACGFTVAVIADCIFRALFGDKRR